MELYTAIEDVSSIIKTRWADANLRKAVSDSLTGDIPEVFAKEPSGMMWRPIATPDGEFCRFYERAKLAGVRPVSCEYTEDAFCSRNFSKCGLAKLTMASGVDKNGHNIIVKRKVVDMRASEGQKLSEVRTLWGERLVDFHHVLHEAMHPEMKDHVADISQWVRKFGPTPRQYYVALFSLAVSNMVMFEDYDVIESESTFIKDVILPAFNEVKDKFGVKPLIVRISSQAEYMQDPYWWCYPEAVEEFMEAHVRRATPVADEDKDLVK